MNFTCFRAAKADVQRLTAEFHQTATDQVRSLEEEVQRVYFFLRNRPALRKINIVSFFLTYF
jgi:hypothetical protein